jgi:hypothetical protein
LKIWKQNPSLRRLCGWEYRGEVPSEATFSRAFKEFAEKKLLDVIHDAVVSENYTGKVAGHASMDSTAIVVRGKSCRKIRRRRNSLQRRNMATRAEKCFNPKIRKMSATGKNQDFEGNRTVN